MEGGGEYYRAGCGVRPRVTLLDQMSAVADGRDLSGLTLDDILRTEKRPVQASPPPQPPPLPASRTLLDIIRDEDPKSGSCKGFVANKDKKSWKSFKDRLKLKRSGSGAAWTSSVHTPTSDILIPNSRSQISRLNSVRNITESAHDMTYLDDVSFDNNNNNGAGAGGRSIRPQISRRSSTRFGVNSASFMSDDGAPNEDDGSAGAAAALSHAPSLRHQMSRRHSTRYSPGTMEDNINSTVNHPTEPPPAREGSRRLSVVLAEERSLSAREAVAAQEAAEAEAAAAAAAAAAEDEVEAAPAPEAGAAPETDSSQQVRMSLMDLLEETDRQMGFVGSRYMIGDEEDEEEFEEEEEEEEESGGGGGGTGGVDQNCCVCMVRHKGSAFIPCGHTFCRLCSRELWVSRGNCPLCNGFILEILDIF